MALRKKGLPWLTVIVHCVWQGKVHGGKDMRQNLLRSLQTEKQRVRPETEASVILCSWFHKPTSAIWPHISKTLPPPKTMTLPEVQVLRQVACEAHLTLRLSAWKRSEVMAFWNWEARSLASKEALILTWANLNDVEEKSQRFQSLTTVTNLWVRGTTFLITIKAMFHSLDCSPATIHQHCIPLRVLEMVWTKVKTPTYESWICEFCFWVFSFFQIWFCLTFHIP